MFGVLNRNSPLGLRLPFLFSLFPFHFFTRSLRRAKGMLFLLRNLVMTCSTSSLRTVEDRNHGSGFSVLKQMTKITKRKRVLDHRSLK